MFEENLKVFKNITNNTIFIIKSNMLFNEMLEFVTNLGTKPKKN